MGITLNMKLSRSVLASESFDRTKSRKPFIIHEPFDSPGWIRAVIKIIFFFRSSDWLFFDGFETVRMWIEFPARDLHKIRDLIIFDFTGSVVISAR